MKTVSAFLMLGLVATSFSTAFAQSTARDRIPQKVESFAVMPIKGNVHRLARAEFDQGKVDGTLKVERVTLAFSRSQSQQADLDALLKQQVDPSSPNYHKWLTAGEFGKRFGLSDTDFKKIVSWVQSQGFELVDAPVSRTSVTFNGTAAQIASALHTDIHRYVINGEMHYANATAPTVPAAFGNVVLGFQSLNDFRPKPRRIITRKVNSHFTSNLSGNHYLAPDDLATIYNIKGLYNAGFDGTGQKLAVVGQTDIIATDVSAFRAAAGLSASQPTVILVPGSSDPGVVSDDIEEANLDLQWAGAIAKNASIIYVNSKSGVFDSLQYAITNNVAPVISISYGSCEQNFSTSDVSILTSWGQQANAQGITISAAVGDSGAADCDYSSTSALLSATHGLAVDIPASLPYVTGIGGTTFNDGAGTYWSTTNNTSNGSALSYIPEVVWNDTASAGDLSATGGGKSTLFAKPSWQTGTGVPSDSMRDIPDVSFSASAANDGYLVCSQGSCVNGFRDANSFLTVFGGTSAGAPVFAGMVALLNQKMGSAQGNLNPTLYSLATSASSAFHDITSGDNKVPCTTGTADCSNGGSIGYSAGTGYDLATGLGSVDAFVLASAWEGGTAASPDFQLAAASSSLAVSTGSSATTTITATALNGFDGAMSWSCSVSSTLSSLATCSVTPDASTPNAKASLKVTASALTATAKPSAKTQNSWWFAAGLFPFGLILIGRAQKRSSAAIRVCCLTLITILVAGAIGCGGGSTVTSRGNSTTPVSGSVTVQASSTAATHTVSVAITVQ